MDVYTLSLFFVICVAFAVVSVFAIRLKVQRDKAFMDQYQLRGLVSELESSIRSDDADLEELAALRVTSAKLARERDFEARKATEYFATIETVLKERDHWRDLYWVEASEHGNAQRQLLEERGRLIHQLKAAGIKPASSPIIERIVAEFSGKHQVSQADYQSAKEKIG